MSPVGSQKLKELSVSGGSSRIFFVKFIMKIHTFRQAYNFLKRLCLLGHVDDLFPFFLRHAKQIFPMLDCMDDLRKISDLRLPPNWSVCLSGCNVFFE